MCSAVIRRTASGWRQLDRRVVDHVDGHPERRTPCPLAHTGLEHPELALVDRELGVAHVPVVAPRVGAKMSISSA